MSLSVSPELQTKAERGPVSDADFLACIEQSLPYGWALMQDLVARLRDGDTAGRPFVRNEVAPETEQQRGQLLRMMASDAMRGALERRYGVRLAFQNCHAIAVFPLDSGADEAFAIYTSPRAQLLNQRPELVDC